MKIPLPYTTLPQKQICPILPRISCVPPMARVRNEKSASNRFCKLVTPTANRNLLTSPSILQRLPVCVK